MRLMHWSWQEYCDIPDFHRRVLIEMIEEEAARMRHDRAAAEARERNR